MAVSRKSAICDKCEAEEAYASFDGARQRPAVEYRTVQAGEYPLKARLRVLKRNLVAQMLGVPGGFREEPYEVRAWWRMDDPPTQLPPPCQEAYYPDPPGLDEQTDLEELYEMWSHHPHLPPITWGSRRRPSELETWPTDRRTAYDNLVLRWELDLRRLLFIGGVPEEQAYSKDWRIQLPWLRFAAACVLYHPPVEKAPVFAEYSGLPPLPGEESEEEPLLGVQTERQRREAQKYARVHAATEEFILKEMWEDRRDLPDDHSKARFAIMSRHFVDLMELQDRVLEQFEQDMEINPPPRDYYIKFSPAEDRDKDLLRKIKAIRKREELASGRSPRLRRAGSPEYPPQPGSPKKSSKKSPKATQGEYLLPVMCALLLQKPGLTPEWLAGELELKPKRVEELRTDGEKLLKV